MQILDDKKCIIFQNVEKKGRKEKEAKSKRRDKRALRPFFILKKFINLSKREKKERK